MSNEELIKIVDGNGPSDLQRIAADELILRIKQTSHADGDKDE